MQGASAPPCILKVTAAGLLAQDVRLHIVKYL